MIPTAFDYVRAHSVEEAIRLLGEHGEDAKLVAGGHSLIPMMKLRFASPSTLIDLAPIPGLAEIAIGAGGVTIGALTTHAQIAADEGLRLAAPALWDAANQLGDPQVRNRGTIGGSLAHADPAADYPAVMLAFEATIRVVGPDGARAIPARAFFHGMFETALGARDVITAVAFAPAQRSAYVKFHHPASHYAVVGAAAALELDGETVRRARVALTGVGESAFEAEHVARALLGVSRGDAAAIAAACAGAAGDADARADTFASATYRRAMCDVFAARAVSAAAAR